MMEHELNDTPAPSTTGMSTGNQTMVEPEETKPEETKPEASNTKSEDVRATTSSTEPLSLKQEDDTKYISGFKLAAVIGSITMVVFILLLDVSIIATVSASPLRAKHNAKSGIDKQIRLEADYDRSTLGYSKDHI